jgi:hypothetical protein
MAERDPFRPHGRPIATERRASLRPYIDSATKLLTEGRRFTPIGIAVSISLPFVLIFLAAFWVLGKDGIVQITSAWGESADANRALAKQVEGLRTDLDAYVTRSELRAKQDQETLSLTRHQLSMTCDLTSELNGGRPREDWCGPPGQGTRFTGPSLGAVTPYHLTQAPWTPP